jgi:hypothetical protein
MDIALSDQVSAQPPLHGLDDLLGGVVEIVGGDDVEAGLADDLLASSTLVPSRRTTSGT